MSKLESNKLWKAASQIAEEVYGLLSQLPEEEKWGMESRLRSRALDLSTDTAEAVGSIDPRDRHFIFGRVKRSLFGIKNVYILGDRTGLFEVEPESIVRINKLCDVVDREIESAVKAIPEFMKQYTVEDKK